MTTMIRIEWVKTGDARVVSLLDYLAMAIEDLDGTRVQMIEVGGRA